MSTETIQERVEVEFSPSPQVADTIQQLLAIVSEIQKLCPKQYESERNGKYVNVDISGFSELGVRVYYGTGCSFKVESLDDLKSQLAKHDPEAVKKQRIESLKAELSKLEQEAA